MFKLFISILTILLASNSVRTQLCSVRKSSGSCVCKRITDDTNIVSEADCSRINLQVFPKPDQLTNDLNLLDLTHNQFTKLADVAFTSNTLETLLLSYNQINFISDVFFKEIPNLKKLDLSHNNLTSFDSTYILENSINLIHLDLSFNYIKTMGNGIFAPLKKLTVLDLSYNDPALGAFLDENPYTLSTTLGVNLDLQILKLENLAMNDLHNFYFVNYTNLKVLSLADNNFTEVPRVPSYLEYLDLSGSAIKDLEAKQLSFYSVKTLKLDRMKNLEIIHDHAFYNLGSLEDLSITNCRNLKEFNPSVFGEMHRNMNTTLKRLSLSGNIITSLNYTFKFLFQDLDFIDLTNNPWNCDCDLLWLLEFDIVLHRIVDIKCSGPSRVATKRLVDITDRDLPKCYPGKYGKVTHKILITILVVLVMCLATLVFYLLYYNPNWYNRSRSLSPDSPYSSVNQG